jgi:hypothetical protein
MNLVELALAHPPEERHAYVESTCSGDTELLETVWKYVQDEQRMNGFLLEPLYFRIPHRKRCLPGVQCRAACR